MGLYPVRRVPIPTKVLAEKKKRKKRRSNLLVLCLLLLWHTSKDHLELMEPAMIKESIPPHTQTKNGLHSRATRPKTI